MSLERWNSFEAVENYPSHIYKDERRYTYYALDYNPDANYDNYAKKSISNFKKDPHHSKEEELYYKKKTIREFSSFLIETFKSMHESYGYCPIIVAVIPSSVPTFSPSYDQRFERVSSIVEKRLEYVKFRWPVSIINNVGHSRVTNKRDPERIKENYSWNGFNDVINTETLVVLDDVITSGAHYRAFLDKIAECHSEKYSPIGLFFARTNRDPSILK